MRMMTTSPRVLCHVVLAVTLNPILCFAQPAATAGKLILDGNLKLGMPLVSAIGLLGAPEQVEISDRTTVMIPYPALGLTLEVESGGTVVEGIHVHATFTGAFASGLRVGSGFQEILDIYHQPDSMTKNRIEYRDAARTFHTREGKLIGADLYAAKGSLYRRVVGLAALARETGEVWALYGFRVEQKDKGIVVTSVRPASAAEYGGLKENQSIVSIRLHERTYVIQSVDGLERLLTRAIEAGQQDIQIQQSSILCTVKVPGTGTLD